MDLYWLRMTLQHVYARNSMYPYHPTLTIVIPVYNENGRIYRTLEQLRAGKPLPGVRLQKVIFSDDGSTDGTADVIRSQIPVLQARLGCEVEVLRYDVNKGRGYAVRQAALQTDTDYVLYVDADFSIPLENIRTCIPFIRKQVDLVYGSKKIPGSRELVRRGLLRRIVGYGHTLVTSLMLGIWAWDYQGGFKLFSRRLIDTTFPLMVIDRWAFDVENIYLAQKLGFTRVEIPIVWGHCEKGSTVRLGRDILRCFIELCRIQKATLLGRYHVASRTYGNYTPLTYHLAVPSR